MTTIVNLICFAFVFINFIVFFILINAKREVEMISESNIKNISIKRRLDCNLSSLMNKAIVILNIPNALLILVALASIIFTNNCQLPIGIVIFMMLVSIFSFAWLLWNTLALKKLGKDIIEEADKERSR